MSDLTLVSKLGKDLKSLDLSKILKYQQKLEDLTQGANTMNAPMYLRDFILAYDETNNILAKATRYLGQAEAELKSAESMAYFDAAPDFLRDNKVKDSSEARKRYIPLDPRVQEAERVKSFAESMVTFLRNKMQEFRLAHDDVKKIAYASDNNNSPYEGT
jgi:hypothetical protein